VYAFVLEGVQVLEQSIGQQVILLIRVTIPDHVFVGNACDVVVTKSDILR
jgi:hypothetical protein